MRKIFGVIVLMLLLCSCGNIDIANKGSEYFPNCNVATEMTEQRESGDVIKEDDIIFNGELFIPDITDKADVKYNGRRETSITFERVLFVPGTANPTNFYYGLTIDKETNDIKYLKDYISSLQELIRRVENEEYWIVSGVIELNTKEEIIRYINNSLEEDDWEKYYSNFYIDEEYVYVIISTPYSDYSVLKVERNLERAIGG